jgi:Ca-activated chloride channel homolog
MTRLDVASAIFRNPTYRPRPVERHIAESGLLAVMKGDTISLVQRLLVMGAVGILVVGATLVANASGQDISGCQNERDANIVAVRVRALTQKLVSVDDLQASNIEISQNHVQQSVCGFVHVNQPSSIGILLDTSGSMREGEFHIPAWSNPVVMTRTAVDELLSTAGTDDEYFLEIVNDHPAIQRDFTHDLNGIRAGLPPAFKGKTALLDAIYVALNAMQKAKHSNRALLILSDGGDNASTHKFRQLSAVVAASGVPLFFVIPGDPVRDRMRLSVFPTGVDATTEGAIRSDLFRLAERSGGYTFSVPNKQQMVSIVRQLSTAIRAPYVLYFHGPPMPGGRGGQDDVHITVNGVRPQPILLYQHGNR